MSWMRLVFGRRRLNQDIAAEIEQHLEEKVDELVARGFTRDEALAAARREFGNVTLIEEKSRDVWRWAWLESLLADVRYAARQLRRSPAFTLAGVLTLALGIGANTAVFSVINAVMLRPLPFRDAGRLVALESRSTRGGIPRPTEFSYPNFFDFRKQNRVFEHMVCYREDEPTLTGFGPPAHLVGEIVSWDLFPLLQVQPMLGRGFLPRDEQAGERVAVISHELWTSRFGGDQSVAGRTISIDKQRYTVVGVAPAGFNFPVGSRQVQVWTTLARDAASPTVEPMTAQRGARMLQVTARLKPGASLAEAHAQMDTIAAALAREYPNENKNVASTYVRPELERMVGDTRQPMLILLGAVGFVLLIACANVANLLLARTAEREREFSVRLSIGAGRARIVRQLLTENLLLALIGSAAGLVIAVGCTRIALPMVAGAGIPRIDESGVDGRVLVFAVALALLTGMLSGVPAAVRIARMAFYAGLKEGARTSTDTNDRLRGALVVAQIALGLVLLSGAALLGASFVHLMQRDVGFRPDHLLTFNISLPEANYPEAQQVDFHARLRERLAAVPGVVSVGAGSPLPLTGHQITISFDIQERPAAPPERPVADMAIVAPGYFRTLNTPLLRGRDFTERDDETSPPVLIVNQAFAEKYFPGENALGKRIESGAISRSGRRGMREIVGVVGNAKQAPLTAEADPIYYLPYRQLAWFPPSILVRSSVPPLALESAVREVVASLDKEVPVYEVRTLDAMRSFGLSGPRFLALLLGSFSGIALLLMAVGLYGVLAYSVTRRTREIGVRVALGADAANILGMVLRRAMLLVAAGIALGLAGAFAGDRLLRSVLYGATPREPVLLALTCAVVAGTAVFAAYLPARRAASIQPMQALRSE